MILTMHNDKYILLGACILLRIACLPVKFEWTGNLLGVLTQYEILGFCRLGLNRLKFYRNKT
jgi:hypothetical protein